MKDRLSFSLDHEIHKELKFQSARKGIPVSKFIIQAVIEKIEKEQQNEQAEK